MVAFKAFLVALVVSAVNGRAMLKRNTESAQEAGQLTYYAPGLGACGYNNGDGDAVVAISHAIFDPATPGGNPNNNPYCGRKVHITTANGQGQNYVATVVDRCVSCNPGDLDATTGVWGALGVPLGVGRASLTWDFI
ncbi:hypothetical protein BT63DRAFT_417022 [Microthyrium microscopicum]|uniref:RlpA-like protein double-psi beta-barrel domain-containing protein n=1 Tax=Microthyrium microscopicum TaxID=703497 RepID=A0A6A6U044_9PEZI|nr:hypothetical protein BT63DRAFT_417022 [Microthyrium microscopicum]